MKLQVSLDEELVKRIDTCADNNYMSRSGLISLACVQFLNQNEMISAINRISLACERVAATGELDEETKKQFDEFEIIAKLFKQQQ